MEVAEQVVEVHGREAQLRLEESADPKVQLEQAIAEARDQHRKLTEQAANVIANQKQTQRRLDRAITEYERDEGEPARQALLLADHESPRAATPRRPTASTGGESFAKG